MANVRLCPETETIDMSDDELQVDSDSDAVTSPSVALKAQLAAGRGGPASPNSHLHHGLTADTTLSPPASSRPGSISNTPSSSALLRTSNNSKTTIPPPSSSSSPSTTTTTTPSAPQHRAAGNNTSHNHHYNHNNNNNNNNNNNTNNINTPGARPSFLITDILGDRRPPKRPRSPTTNSEAHSTSAMTGPLGLSKDSHHRLMEKRTNASESINCFAESKGK